MKLPNENSFDPGVPQKQRDAEADALLFLAQKYAKLLRDGTVEKLNLNFDRARRPEQPLPRVAFDLDVHHVLDASKFMAKLNADPARAEPQAAKPRVRDLTSEQVDVILNTPWPVAKLVLEADDSVRASNFASKFTNEEILAAQKMLDAASAEATAKLVEVTPGVFAQEDLPPSVQRNEDAKKLGVVYYEPKDPSDIDAALAADALNLALVEKRAEGALDDPTED